MKVILVKEKIVRKIEKKVKKKKEEKEKRIKGRRKKEENGDDNRNDRVGDKGEGRDGSLYVRGGDTQLQPPSEIKLIKHPRRVCLLTLIPMLNKV